MIRKLVRFVIRMAGRFKRLAVRVATFGIVGVVCTLLQIVILGQLKAFIPSIWASMFGFLISAQLNFVLSYFITWRDSERKRGLKLAATWLRFFGVVLIGATANTAAFALFHLVLVDWMAVCAATVISTSCTFFLNHLYVLQPERQVNNMTPELTPSSAIARELAAQQSVAFFLPVHNEAEVLPETVSRTVNFLRQRGCAFKVIIVEDGSTDGTPGIVEKLQALYPKEIIIVRHERNLGYGGALRSGIRAGLETGYDWIAFMDSDGQFKASDMGAFIDHGIARSADVVIGWRIERADSFVRKLMGRGWHFVAHVLLGYHAIDTDCGFKAFNRRSMLSISDRLIGNGAEISGEILARLNREEGIKIEELGVTHYPRELGESSGGDRSVALKAFRDVMNVWANLRGYDDFPQFLRSPFHASTPSPRKVSS